MADQGFVPPANTYTYYLPSKRPIYIPKVDPITGQPTTSAQIHERIGMAIDFEAQQKAGTQGYGGNPLAETPVAQGISQTYKNIADPVTRVVGKGISKVAGSGLLSDENAQKVGDTISRAVIPQNITEAGAMAGTLAAPALASLRVPGIRAGLGRAAMATVGGAAGAVAEGRAPLEGAVLGGAGSLAGEAGGKGIELTRRLVTNLTNGLYRKDAKLLGQAIEGLAPDLKGAHSPESLRDIIMTNDGRNRLFKSLDDAYGKIEQALTTNQTHTPQGQMQGNTIQMGVLTPDRFRAMREELKNLFATGWRAEDPTKLPTPDVMSARERMRGLMDETLLALPTQLRDQFVEARSRFKVGMNIVDLLKKANGPSNRLFKPEGDAITFQTTRIQNMMSAGQSKLEAKLGKDVYDAMAEVVFRGTKPGRVDTEGISIPRLTMRQVGPVSGGAFTEGFPKLSIPNYVGAPKPLMTPTGAQILMNLLGIGGASSLLPVGPDSPASPR